MEKEFFVNILWNFGQDYPDILTRRLTEKEIIIKAQ